MAVNKYFQIGDGFTSEQSLLEQIYTECIQITGTDAFYIIRNDSNTDPIYGEDPLKTFTQAFPIEIYNSDASDFEGQKEIFSKFGIQIKNEYTVLMSRRRFLQLIPVNLEYQRPREGDLIWIPHLRGKGMLYEITFCNPEKDFFTLGKTTPYYYELKLEAFKYSEELINTGIPSIDQIRAEHAYTIMLQLQNTEESQGNYIINEVVFQGNSLSNATTTAYVNGWNAPTLQLYVSNIMGEFITGQKLYGSVSNAQYVIEEYDATLNQTHREITDNAATLDEALLTEIFTTPGNPLGQPTYDTSNY
jgi:Virus neck protein